MCSGLSIGVAGLIGMTRLVAGAFGGGVQLFVWLVTAVVMLGWVAYSGWRARRSRLSPPAAAVVGFLGLAGCIVGWWAVVGAVVALAGSLIGFAVVWWHDRPARIRWPIRIGRR